MSKKSTTFSVASIKIKTKTVAEQASNTTTKTTNHIPKSYNSNATDNSPTDMQAVKIKKELPSDEIKEFAENTMNELLGWYGFEGVERLDLTTKTSRLLQSAAVAQANNAALSAANNNNNNNSGRNNANNNNNHSSAASHQRHCMEKRRSRSRAATLLQQQQQQQQQPQQQNEHLRNLINKNNNNNNNNNKNGTSNNVNNKNSSGSSNNNNNGSRNNNCKMALNCIGGNYRSGNRGNASIGAGVGSSAGGGGGESTASDHDTRSSREEDSKSPISAGKNTLLEEKIDQQNCCWCRRPVPDNAPEFLTTTDGPRYCSESCFTQSRRASFKKAKTCDWCKHVRHAISYVDFQDGASQLQFCSDKCLNQYKMQIFCKETQAHLDMNPHLREQGLDAVASGNGAGLITPDLWLRNCRSRSASPASTLSVSPGPTGPTVIMHNNANLATGSSSSPGSSAASNLGLSSATPHKPMISVAPVSKLMSKNVGMLTSTPVPTSNRVSPKHSRKKRPLRSSISGDVGSHGDLSAIARDAGPSTTSIASGLLGKAKSLLSAASNKNLRTSPGVHLPPAGAGASSVKPCASALNQFAGSSVQDLHMTVPPLSPMLEQHTPPHQLPQHALNASGHGATSIPPAFFATPASAQPPNSGGPHQQLPPGAFPPHPPAFLSNPGAPNAVGMLPRYLGAGGFPIFPPPPHIAQPPLDLVGGLGLGAFLGAPPPVTVMVPYPIIIPLPIPIPVPLPVVDFYKAYLPQEERAKLKQKEESEANAAANEPSTSAAAADSDCEQKIEVTRVTVNEEPLDFTKTKDFVEDQHEEPASSLKRALSEEHLTATTTTLSPATPKTNITTTIDVTLAPEDSPCSPAASCKATHCIVRADESETPKRDLDVDVNDTPAAGRDTDDAKQKLPKFKITRLQTKRTLTQTKETPTTLTSAAAECSRPLRKRKRIIDCDFQKLALKDAAMLEADGEDLGDTFNVDAEAKPTTTTSVGTTACNSNIKAQSKK